MCSSTTRPGSRDARATRSEPRIAARVISSLVALALAAVVTGCVTSVVSTPLTSAVRATDAGEYERAAQLCRDVMASDASPDVKRDARVLLARLHVARLGSPELGLALYQEVLDFNARDRSAAEALWVLGSHAFRSV